MKNILISTTTFLVFVFGFILLAGCGDEPSRPQTGFISVSVIDGLSQSPVADVEVEIAPNHLIVLTNNDGLAVFEVDAGDYFVNAKVCCLGPGFIEYHVPVTVKDGKTMGVDLEACLACL